MSPLIPLRRNSDPRSTSGTRRPGRSGTAAPSVAKAWPIALATHENHYKDHSEDGEFGRARVARLGCHHLVDDAEAQSAHHRNRERQERPEGRGPHRQRQQIRTDCLSIERGCGRAVQDRSQGRQAAGDAPGDQTDARHRDSAEPCRLRVAGRGADLLTDRRELQIDGQKHQDHRHCNQREERHAAQDDSANLHVRGERLWERCRRRWDQARDIGERQQYLAHADRQDQETHRRLGPASNWFDDESLDQQARSDSHGEAGDDGQPPIPPPVVHHLEKQHGREHPKLSVRQVEETVRPVDQDEPDGKKTNDQSAQNPQHEGPRAHHGGSSVIDTRKTRRPAAPIAIDGLPLVSASVITSCPPNALSGAEAQHLRPLPHFYLYLDIDVNCCSSRVLGCLRHDFENARGPYPASHDTRPQWN